MSHSRSGLGILGFLSVADVVMLAVSDGKHPPFAVVLLGAVLGVASLFLVVRCWRNSSAPVGVLIAMRVLSALTALPAFFVSDVPAAARGFAGVFVGLTALGSFLLVREPSLEVAR